MVRINENFATFTSCTVEVDWPSLADDKTLRLPPWSVVPVVLTDAEVATIHAVLPTDVTNVIVPATFARFVAAALPLVEVVHTDTHTAAAGGP